VTFSDHGVIERLIDENPDCLSRRRSGYECGQTPRRAALASPDGLGILTGEPDDPLLELPIDLGADPEEDLYTPRPATQT
jgi:hypothetical protein